MNKAIPAFDAKNFLLGKIAEEFICAASLIERLDDRTYSRTTSETGSIGGHFRHNLDFANVLLSGLRTGKIDYSKRMRDARTEVDRRYAIGRIETFIDCLQILPPEILTRKVLVRSELEENYWYESSAGRELEFLHSHTVHHHALIAEKLKSFGVKVAFDFGVAPSTLKYRAQIAQNAG